MYDTMVMERDAVAALARGEVAATYSHGEVQFADWFISSHTIVDDVTARQTIVSSYPHLEHVEFVVRKEN